MDKVKLLQYLYNKEINAKLESFWDGGVHWYLGDEMNKFIADGYGETWEEAIDELFAAALEHYPEIGKEWLGNELAALEPEVTTGG